MSIELNVMALKQTVDISFDGLNLSRLSEKYHHGERKPISFDFKAATKRILPNEKLHHIDAHYVHYYPGRIFPYIPFFMLSLNDFEEFSGYVLDPFAGSGTILLESITNPFVKRSAIGVEKNPVGRLMSKVKSTPLDGHIIDELLGTVCSEYNETKGVINQTAEFKNRQIWFSDKACRRLTKLKHAVETLRSSQDYKDFFWLCYSGTIRKVSKANPYIPPPVVLKPERYKDSKGRYEKLKGILKDSDDPDVLKKFSEIALMNKKRLATLNNSTELKNGEVFSEIIWDDARKIMKGKLVECGRIDKKSAQILGSGSVDLVMTSPPYLTAQKYIRTNRLELFWLGYGAGEISSLESSSIGTERVSLRTEIAPLGIGVIDQELADLQTRSLERAVQVFQYFKDMLNALAEMRRVLRKNSYAVLVVGENKVLQKNMETFRLLTEAALSFGFEEIVILKDTIRTRSMLTKRNGTGGMIKNEYVIVLKKVR